MELNMNKEGISLGLKMFVDAFYSVCRMVECSLSMCKKVVS